MAVEYGIGDLLEHAEWLRLLATRLLRDDDPEDVVQETWVAALRSPPAGPPDKARPWLAEVMRNFARRRWRQRAARLSRDQVVPTDQVQPGPEALLERAQLQRTLADLVLALEEPYRTMVLLRYYEGKNAAQIAAAQGIPAGTVRWRLKEAVDRLRQRLDAQTGERRRWQAVLAPLALGSAGRVTVSLLRTKVVVGGVAALLVAAAALLVVLRDREGVGWRQARRLRSVPPPLSRVFLAEGGKASSGIEGVVLDPAGRPALGAVVTLVRAPVPGETLRRGPVGAATAGADGGFAFDDAWVGDCQLTATLRGYQAAVSPPFTLATGKRERVTLRLGGSGATLSGRVLDEGGIPIPGAAVTASLGYPWMYTPPGSPRPLRQFRVITDESGRYELTLELREYTLRAEAGGYAPVETTVPVTAAVTRDLHLAPAARLVGRVVEGAGRQPVPDAEVLLWSGPRGRTQPRSVRSDADGRFVIDDADAGEFEILVHERRRNLHGRVSRVVAIPTREREGIEVIVNPGVTITGQVVDEAGHGLDGIPVALWSMDIGTLGGNDRTASEAEGRFVLGASGPGRYRLSAQVGASNGEATVSVTEAGARDVRLVLGPLPPSGTITGRVLAAGAPVPGTLVRVEPLVRTSGILLGTAETGADGAFRIAGLPAQPSRLVAWHPQSGIADLTVEPAVAREQAPITVALEPGAIIAGTVNFEDGTPAPGISVAATRQEGMVVYDSTSTGADGRFLIRSLAAGRYTVRATRRIGPYNLWTSREAPDLKLVDVGPGERRDDVVLELRRGGRTIGGTVVDPDGRPALGAVVVANREENGNSWKPFAQHIEHQVVADEQGQFRLDDVENDTFALWASMPGFADAEAGGIKAGRTDVRLAFARPGRLAGVVVGADGRPVADFHLSVALTTMPGESSARRNRRLEAGQRPPLPVHDPAGAFAVESLPADSYLLKVTSADGSGAASQTITMAAGEQKTGLHVVLQAAVRARGRVVALETGEPLPGLHVRTRVAGRPVEARTAADGSYELQGLMPGEEITVETQMSEVVGRVPEYDTLTVPRDTAVIEIPAFRLMTGDWRARDRTGGTVGLRLATREGHPTVIGVRGGSPAAQAGIAEGQVVLAVDGREVKGLGIGAIMYLMREPPGSKVTLLLEGGGGKRTVALATVK